MISVIPGGAANNPIKSRWMGIFDGAGIHGTDEISSLGTDLFLDLHKIFKLVDFGDWIGVEVPGAMEAGGAVDLVGDGGVGIRAGNRDVGVGGAQVGVMPGNAVGAVVGQRNDRLRLLGVEREAQHVAGVGVAGRVGGADLNGVSAIGQQRRVVAGAEGGGALIASGCPGRALISAVAVAVGDR